MIFKRLFTPAHQDKHPEKRIDAIDNLSASQEKDRRILHELAFNDDSAKVSLKALEKLDSFTLWLKAYENHVHDAVQKKAKAQVLLGIENPHVVDDVLFFDIIKQNKHNVLLREMLFSSERLRSHQRVCVESLIKLGTENDVRRFFAEQASDEHKDFIIEAINDEKQLRRFVKLNNSEDISRSLQQKLHDLEALARRPHEIKSRATLINSRMMALSDEQSFEKISQQKHSLVKEFEQLKTEFSLLSEDEAAQISEKYLHLKEKVERRLQQLEADYMEKKHLEGINDSILDIKHRADSIFQQVALLKDTDTNDQLDGQLELLKRSLDDLRLELDDINLSQGNREHISAHTQLIKSIEEYQSALSVIPEAIHRNTQMDALIQDASNFVNHNSDEAPELERFQAIEQQAKSLIKAGVGEQRKLAFQVLREQINDYRKQAIAQAKRAEKRCFSKLSACSNMIKQGKFKSAIATFNTASDLIQAIDRPSASLQRKYDELKDKVSDLKDWQSYIAAPRKPELIKQAQALASNSSISVNERASLVKQYRKSFLSLGRLFSPEDDALNQQFDEVIEQAYAPCRVFYAEQDKRRAANLSKGKQIVDALEALSAVEDPTELNKHLQSLSKLYRQLGEVERQAGQDLYKQYQAAYKPLRAKVNRFYEENASAKAALVERAKSLLEVDDLDQAIESAKTLQNKWKQIGFAGKDKDQTLWQAFREANDQVFARLQARQHAQKQESKAQKEGVEHSLNEFEKGIDNANEAGALSELESEGQHIQSLILGLGAAQQKALFAKLNTLNDRLKKKLASFEQEKRHKMLEQVFDVLRTFKDEQVPVQASQLSMTYRQAFEQNLVQHVPAIDGLDREGLLMAFDILFKEGSHVKDSVKKKDVQLKLMAAKLEGEAVPEPDDILHYWIAQGPLNETDMALLNTFKNLYVD